MKHREVVEWYIHNTGPDSVVVSSPRRTACGLPAHSGTGRKVYDGTKPGRKKKVS